MHQHPSAQRASCYWSSILRTLAMLVAVACTWQAVGATVQIRMVNFAFQLSRTNIFVGDTVQWTNTTLTSHTVTSSNGTFTSSGLFSLGGTHTFTFTNAGTYGYYCSPHLLSGMTGVIVVQAPNQPPTVTITNPVSGTVLAAPASLTLRATASDPDGAVTNVQFLSWSTNSLGNSQASPYSLPVSSLAAGNYSFTAVAKDNLGLAKTSAIVEVSVVTPGPISFAKNITAAGGILPLRVTTTVGLNYAIEYSTNFANWQTYTNFLTTNAVMSFDSPTAPDPRRFYRARLLPNP